MSGRPKIADDPDNWILPHELAAADDQRAKDDEFRKTTASPAKPQPAAPKVHRISLLKGADGTTTGAKRHYDDGSEDTIHISRLTDMPGPAA